MPLQAARPPVARGPGLADEAGVIPGILEDVGEQRVLRRQRSVEHTRLSDAPDMAPGEQCRPRGRARRTRRVRLREHDPFRRDAIKRWRPHHRIPERRSVRVGLVVGVDEQDIGPPVDPRRGACGSTEKRRSAKQFAPGNRWHFLNSPFCWHRLRAGWTACYESPRNSDRGACP